jgi:hypothetical protein
VRIPFDYTPSEAQGRRSFRTILSDAGGEQEGVLIRISSTSPRTFARRPGEKIDREFDISLGKRHDTYSVRSLAEKKPGFSEKAGLLAADCDKGILVRH